MSNLPAFVVAIFMMTSPPDGAEKPKEEPPTKTGRKTLGGTQFWSDYVVHHGWRIQKNVNFGNFRLLNADDRVDQTGSYETCLKKLDEIIKQQRFPAIKPSVVVTMHGLGRTRQSMESLGEFLKTNGDYSWVNVGYASTRSQIVEHSEALKNVLDELARIARLQDPAIDLEIYFVGHSMGNIVIRNLLHDYNKLPNDQKTWRPVSMVMLGPPNQGSAMANLLKENKAFKLLAGVSGQDLTVEWQELQTHLATPDFPFAIIAGGRGKPAGYNPLLEGDDDLIVSVEETKLAGAADFLVVPAIHTYIMYQQVVKDATLSFFKHGYFVSAERQIPLPKDQP